ncbi:PTS system glucose-specific IIA component [Staphylococcus gallinarum]|uniref:PTS system glucose-specific EIIA component n=1 Tax=Staphylococcus gallinarum TaxID=1293 RepID=A0A380FHZ9_STAGA|nr:PTS system glucose-specific IIA component [Staphylococcus gallinarum]
MKFLVESGDTVNVGDPILRFDLNYIKENAKSVISPIIITNSDNTTSVSIADVASVY